MAGGGTNMVNSGCARCDRELMLECVCEFERSACPVCGDPDCTFPPECRDAVGVWPEPTYGEE